MWCQRKNSVIILLCVALALSWIVTALLIYTYRKNCCFNGNTTLKINLELFLDKNLFCGSSNLHSLLFMFFQLMLQIQQMLLQQLVINKGDM